MFCCLWIVQQIVEIKFGSQKTLKVKKKIAVIDFELPFKLPLDYILFTNKYIINT